MNLRTRSLTHASRTSAGGGKLGAKTASDDLRCPVRGSPTYIGAQPSERDAFSYFDIWTGTDYAGTVRIRDRLMGYDISDPTLAALVERPPDENGDAHRATDWYDIGEVEFGREE